MKNEYTYLSLLASTPNPNIFVNYLIIKEEWLTLYANALCIQVPKHNFKSTIGMTVQFTDFLIQVFVVQQSQ